MRVSITGACCHECLRLKLLLEMRGHRVSYHTDAQEKGIIIAALSGAPLTGWGRYVWYLRELGTRSGYRVIAAIPEVLENVYALNRVCYPLVFHGDVDRFLQELETAVRHVSTADDNNLTLSLMQKLTLFVVWNLFGSDDFRLYDGSREAFIIYGREAARLLGFRHRHHLMVFGDGTEDLLKDCDPLE